MGNNNRSNWIPYQRNDGKFIVLDKVTNEHINDAQGYGYKSEEKCWNWIRNQQR